LLLLKLLLKSEVGLSEPPKHIFQMQTALRRLQSHFGSKQKEELLFSSSDAVTGGAIVLCLKKSDGFRLVLMVLS
jgi:hypothetical protein